MGGIRFPEYDPQPFPHTNEDVIICPFWDDVSIVQAGSIYHNSGGSDRSTKARVSQLIQDSLGFSFHPTGVFIATWEAVSYFAAFSFPEVSYLHCCLVFIYSHNSQLYPFSYLTRKTPSSVYWQPMGKTHSYSFYMPTV